YYFAGSKVIIDALFERNAATYELGKHRIIYRCDKVSSSFTCSPGEMRMGDMNRLNELAEFSVDFAKSYEGEMQTFDHMKLGYVFSGIMNDNIYQWNYGKDICSIAQAIHNDEYGFPVIGHVYTNPSLS
ncbi:MAG: hypothetical protein IPP72_13710, partial [Chitinophagaceae bacterium]|nr:hypothetical protein [Chitinophagaceae bacterium]